jgi:hypothetical protein
MCKFLGSSVTSSVYGHNTPLSILFSNKRRTVGPKRVSQIKITCSRNYKIIFCDKGQTLPKFYQHDVFHTKLAYLMVKLAAN